MKIEVGKGLPSDARLRTMTPAQLFAWCQRDTWRRLGGRGGCPWVGERDNAKPPKAKSNADHWKAERAAYLRLFAPSRSINNVQPWVGGEHLHKCPACEVQPKGGDYYLQRKSDEGYENPNDKGWNVEWERGRRYWWCDVPDADCPHPWEHPCHEHDPESAVNRQSAERAVEDHAHDEAGGDAPGECYDDDEAESGPNGTEEGDDAI